MTLEEEACSGEELAKIVARLADFSGSDTERPATEAVALLDSARSACPIPHSHRTGGYYMLLNYKDVRQAMLNPQIFASSPSASRPLADKPEEQFRFAPLDFDGAEHTFWRGIFTTMVNAKSVARVKEPLRADVARILGTMAARGYGDAAVELGDTIPQYAIFHLLEFKDTESQKAILDLHYQLVANFNDPIKKIETLREIARFGLSEAQKRKGRSAEDVLTHLTRSKRDGRPLNEEELGIAICSVLAPAFGTTAAAITRLCHDVLSRPKLREQLSADPSLLPVAIEESLRLHPPLIGLFRRSTEPVELHGQVLPESTSFLMCWSAANLDPEVFDDPHSFKLNRASSPHLTFGVGRHTCPGNPVARLELQLVLEELLRYPNIRLADSSPLDARFVGGNLTAIPSLPIVFG
jgi:cytochrome P450